MGNSSASSSDQSATKITGAQALMESLVREGVEVIFGYPGGAIMPTYDALYDYRDKIRHILVRHEQGAGHAAEGYARVSGKPGVALVTSGPGATNLVTAIADAMMDSIPIVCITGQVPRAFLGTDAFQETDVIGVTMPITKWNYQITSADEVPQIVAKAFHIATTGRPGPVVIDFTKNAQTELCDFTYEPVTAISSMRPALPARKDDVARAAQLINSAKRPYILAGHGLLISKAHEELKLLAEKAGIPVSPTLMGLSVFPSDHPLNVGMLGMHGNYGPNKLTNSADVLIAIGMRFDDRVTGKLSEYATKCKVIHIEVDPAEVGKNVRPEVGLTGDAKIILTQLLPLIEKNSHEGWVEQFRELNSEEFEKVIRTECYPETGGIRMSEAVRVLSEESKGTAIVVADVGQHQMMAARYYKFKSPDSFVTSGGLGTMGFALPAAFGAKVGAPDRQVVAIIGDGGFQMTIQELGTIAQEKTPVKIIVLNNNFLGMVRQWQELFFDNRYSFVHMDNPNFVKICEGYSIPAKRISERADLQSSINELLVAKGPYFLEIMVEKEQNVFPMVPSGCSIADVRLE